MPYKAVSVPASCVLSHKTSNGIPCGQEGLNCWSGNYASRVKPYPHQDGGSDYHLSRGRLNVGVQRIKGSVFLLHPTSLIWQIFPDRYCSKRVFMLKFCKRNIKFLANIIGGQVINTHLDMFLSSGTTISYFTINFLH